MRTRADNRYGYLLIGVAGSCLFTAAAAAQTPSAAALAESPAAAAGQDFAATPPSAQAPVASPQTASTLAAPQQDTLIGDIIVTAQRREGSLQDVPLAVIAISGQGLNDQKIETGGELVRAVPNINFTKTNFSGFNFTIRGIGTKAISVPSDAAVAVSFNSTPLIRSRLFEQEFFDISRVEALRGLQGTLYGRNATGGVVNILPQLPTQQWEGLGWVDFGNFASTHKAATINVPLTSTLAVPVAAAYIARDGHDFNTFTNWRVNSCDLYSTRLSALWEPSDNFRASFMWQHFYEDDDRSRSGKALHPRSGADARGLQP